MPIYDYQCRSCGTEFDALRSLQDDDRDVICPVCQEKDAERLVSLTATELFKKGGSCGSGRGPMRFG